MGANAPSEASNAPGQATATECGYCSFGFTAAALDFCPGCPVRADGRADVDL
jgi:hypothetical protein